MDLTPYEEDDDETPLETGGKIRFRWNPPIGWGKAALKRRAFKKEVLVDDADAPVPKERTWLITTVEGEAFLVALNPEFRGTSPGKNWYVAAPKAKKSAKRGPPKSRLS